MHFLKCFPEVLAAAALSISSSMGADPSDLKTMQTPKQFHYSSTKAADIRYLLFLPKGYDSAASKRWPLILFLHGAGERGTDVWLVAKHGPPKIVAQHPELEFILVSPQCPDGQIWSSEVLLALLDDVTKSYSVDKSRVYLTGLSMGGYGTWDLGLSNPERFAAIAPICGGGEMITALLSNGEKGAALRSLGIWAFHGAKDSVVPVNESERMVEIVKRFGAKDVKLTIYPEADHDCWTQTYNNPEFYRWLLQHKRQ